jgi:hypothetical protein
MGYMRTQLKFEELWYRSSTLISAMELWELTLMSVIGSVSYLCPELGTFVRQAWAKFFYALGSCRIHTVRKNIFFSWALV